MKKYFISFLLLMIAPSICCGASARYTQLVREKQRKIEELEKCTGSTKGLQIAGISTLGLTAVGVAGNIAEAKIIKSNAKTIEKQETTIQDKEKEYAKKKQDKADAEAAEVARVAEYNRTHTLAIIAEQDIARINSLAGNIGDKAVTSGYEPEQLPEPLRSRFADAMIGFIGRCREHNDNKKSDNVLTTKFGGGWAETNWETYKTQTFTTLAEDYVIPENSVGKIILQCLIQNCVNDYKTTDSKQCVPSHGATSTDPTADDGTPNDNGTVNGDGTTPNKTTNPVVDGGTTPDQITKVNTVCTDEFKQQNNAAEVVEKDGKCYIKKCETGYFTSLDGFAYWVADDYGLDSDVVCTKDNHAELDEKGKPITTPAKKPKTTATNVCKTKLGDLKIGETKYVTKSQCQGEIKDNRTSRWKRDDETTWHMQCETGAKLVCVAEDCLQMSQFYVNQKTNKCETKFCGFSRQCKAKGGRPACLAEKKGDSGGNMACEFVVGNGSLSGDQCEGIDFLKTEWVEGTQMYKVGSFRNSETIDVRKDNVCLSGIICYGQDYNCED